MKTRRLQCFMATAVKGNLTRAAESLFLSQSALSTQIKQLENELGYLLFERNARGMTLTPRGQDLHPYAREALHAMNKFESKATNLKTSPTTLVTVGLNTDPAFLHLAELNGCTRSTIPGISLSFIVAQSHQTGEFLQSGKMDLGFRFGEWNDNEITNEILASVPLSIVIPTALADQVEFNNWKGLADLPWITYPNCPFIETVHKRISTYGIALNSVGQSNDEAIRRELVAEGTGVTVLRKEEGEQLRAKGLAKIWPETLSVPLYLSIPTSKYHTTPIKDFRKLVKRVWNSKTPMDTSKSCA